MQSETRYSQDLFERILSIAKRIAKSRNLNEIKEVFPDLADLLNSDVVWLGRYVPDGDRLLSDPPKGILKFWVGVEDGETLDDITEYHTDEKDRPAIWCLDMQEESENASGVTLVVNDVGNEFEKRNQTRPKPRYGDPVNSLVYLPLYYNKINATPEETNGRRLVGVMSIQSQKMGAYPNPIQFGDPRYILESLQEILANALVRILETEERKILESLRLVAIQYSVAMNRHFVTNALTVVKNMVDKPDHHSNGDLTTYLGTLTTMTNEMIDTSTTIPLIKELELVKNYHDVRKNFSKKSWVANLQTDLNGDHTEILMHVIPRMLIQPFVENAIKHGAKSYHNDYHIDILIRIHKDDEYLDIEIIDDGIGYKQGTINTENFRKENDEFYKSSVTVQNIEKRVKVYNQLARLHEQEVDTAIMTFEIQDRKDLDYSKTGTHVMIRIPVQYDFKNMLNVDIITPHFAGSR